MPGVNQSGTLEHWHTELGWQCLEGTGNAVPIEAKVGDVVVFSSLTPHRTGPKRTSEERKSYILQYCHEGSVKVSGAVNETQNAPDRQYPIVINGKPVA